MAAAAEPLTGAELTSERVIGARTAKDVPLPPEAQAVAGATS